MEMKNVGTREGLNALKKEYEERQELAHVISQRIGEAREQGDISENAEWDAAREEQSKNNARLEELKALINNYEVRAGSKDGKVAIGSKVTIYEVGKTDKVTYYMVGSSEVDVLNNKISHTSPLGAALMGMKARQTVTVVLPSGKKKNYKISKVENA